MAYVSNYKLVSTTTAGAQGDNASDAPNLSGNGSRVAFSSAATNLSAADTNRSRDVYVKDLTTGVLRLASTTAAGAVGDDTSGGAVLSSAGERVLFQSFAANFSAPRGGGTFVGFVSNATNLVAGDANGRVDLFVKNLATGEITRVTAQDISGVAGDVSGLELTLSGDGSLIAFSSANADLVPGDANAVADVFTATFSAATEPRRRRTRPPP